MSLATDLKRIRGLQSGNIAYIDVVHTRLPVRVVDPPGELISSAFLLIVANGTYSFALIGGVQGSSYSVGRRIGLKDTLPSHFGCNISKRTKHELRLIV